jgi:hypothetical protein
MNRLDRRRVLTSLAGGAAVAGVSHALSKKAFADSESGVLRERAVRHYCWVLAQQRSRTHTQHPIDYWCGLFGPIRHENYLPPQIARGLIAYEDFPYPIDSENRAIEAFNQTAKFYDRNWLDPETLDRLAVKPVAGSNDFQFIFSSFVGKNSRHPRTALLAVDSPLGEFAQHGAQIPSRNSGSRRQPAFSPKTRLETGCLQSPD